MLSFIDRDKNCIKGGVKSQKQNHPSGGFVFGTERQQGLEGDCAERSEVKTSQCDVFRLTIKCQEKNKNICEFCKLRNWYDKKSNRLVAQKQVFRGNKIASIIFIIYNKALNLMLQNGLKLKNGGKMNTSITINTIDYKT